jgi:hypothetical protein
MPVRKLLSLLVATVSVLPALPAHAESDTAPPRSTFTTANGSLLLRSALGEGKVEGDSADDLGISAVVIRYCNRLFCQYRFEPSPTVQPYQHWTFNVPPDGTWQVNVRAVDAAGNMEFPGPEITISVLPVELPDLPLPPLPLLQPVPEPR